MILVDAKCGFSTLWWITLFVQSFCCPILLLCQCEAEDAVSGGYGHPGITLAGNVKVSAKAVGVNLLLFLSG
jgi:hypothetical protein